MTNTHFTPIKLLIFGALGLLILLLIILNVFQSRTSSSGPTPSSIPLTRTPQQPGGGFLNQPKNVQEVPSLETSDGPAIDTQSSSIQNSQREIRKLAPYLPYKEDISLANGQIIGIYIPPLEDQLDPWSLSVHVNDIDYQVPVGDPQYNTQKQMFLEAANKVYGWIQSKGGNLDNLYITWGDRTLVNDRANEWLKN